MTVAFNKVLIKNFGLKMSQLTLKDLSCTARENKTHIILGSPTTSCGTKVNKKDTDDQTYYTNKVVYYIIDLLPILHFSDNFVKIER